MRLSRRAVRALPAAVLAAGTACVADWITVTGPVSRLESGTICVEQAEPVPGGGCADYPSPESVAGIEVGDCVVMRLYAESARFHDVREVACPAG